MLRIDSELHDALQRWADDDLRSLNRQIGYLLRAALSKRGVKLGLVRGSELADPRGLLEGTGKVHKHVPLRTAADLRRPGVKPLVTAAFKAWQDRQNARRP